MEVIDLLNMVANGETPPSPVWHGNELLHYDAKSKDYYLGNGCHPLFYNINNNMHDKIVVDETICKTKIENLSYNELSEADFIGTGNIPKRVTDRINEIINWINENDEDCDDDDDYDY